MLLVILAMTLTAQANILCGRDAEIVPVNPTFENEADACDGTVVLQGISYECGQVAEVDSKRRKFLADLQRNGEEYCQEYCRKRGTATHKCRGLFTPPNKCGWTVPKGEAESVGKRAPCDSSCGGSALIYCSIFHASYFNVKPEMFKDTPANCRCEKAR